MGTHLKAETLKRKALKALDAVPKPLPELGRGDTVRAILNKSPSYLPDNVRAEAELYLRAIDREQSDDEERIQQVKERLMSAAPAHNPLGRPWPMQTNGDLWKCYWESLVALGPRSVATVWVKGHEKQKHIDMRLTAVASKRGNDQGDLTARKGVELVGMHIVALAAWLQDKHGDYTKFMDRVHYYMIQVMERVKAKREAKRVLLTAATDKHTFGKTQYVFCYGLCTRWRSLHAGYAPPLPRGVHKFHQDRWPLDRIRAFIAETRRAPEIES